MRQFWCCFVFSFLTLECSVPERTQGTRGKVLAPLGRELQLSSSAAGALCGRVLMSRWVRSINRNKVQGRMITGMRSGDMDGCERWEEVGTVFLAHVLRSGVAYCRP